MNEQESVTLICHETRMLRLRGAELESRALNATRELEEALSRRRALMERLRETQNSFLRTIGASANRAR